jgi:hypothetical protein
MLLTIEGDVRSPRTSRICSWVEPMTAAMSSTPQSLAGTSPTSRLNLERWRQGLCLTRLSGSPFGPCGEAERRR